MDSDTRQAQILELARDCGRVEVIPLAAELNVATETIRRDLRALADRRLVKRVHGGAIPLESAAFESAVDIAASVRTMARCGTNAVTRRQNHSEVE